MSPCRPPVSRNLEYCLWDLEGRVRVQSNSAGAGICQKMGTII